jgi:hypothetical protein
MANNKLEDFRLETYEDREMLITGLELYRDRYKSRWLEKEKARVEALLLRLSRTECQHGGCAHCNPDRAREEAEYYASLE